jgi:DNA helicase-2/ATP-dependent DNA helicase PcrA
VINTPPRGIGPKTVEELWRWAQALEVSPWAALESLGDGLQRPQTPPPFRAAAIASLIRFRELIAALIEEAHGLTPPELLNELVERVAFRRYLAEGFEDGDERWANVQELITAAAQYDALEAHALPASSNVALVADVDELDTAAAATLIAARGKGAEFPVVTSSASRRPCSRTSAPSTQMEEERRSMYVGMTRARGGST